MHLDQAIFTSAITTTSDGYHLVRRSRGIARPDAAALAAWGPAHDALLPEVTESFNFFPLPSGAHCVSLTSTAGAEPSRRGAVRLLTHCLVVTPEDFAKLRNDPFLLATLAARHARGLGSPGVLSDNRGEEFPQIELPEESLGKNPLPLGEGRVRGNFAGNSPSPASAEGTSLRTPSHANSSYENAAALLLDYLLDGARLLVRTETGGDHQPRTRPTQRTVRAAVSQPKPASPPRPIGLMHQVFARLPDDLRPRVSFTTGLRHSPRRPFRVQFLPGHDPRQAQRLATRSGLTLVDLTAEQIHATVSG